MVTTAARAIVRTVDVRTSPTRTVLLRAGRPGARGASGLPGVDVAAVAATPGVGQIREGHPIGRVVDVHAVPERVVGEHVEGRVEDAGHRAQRDGGDVVAK